MTPKEEAYKCIEQLVERFELQYSSYRKSDYNETLTRRDFIDPFFKALGWDIDNEQGYAEAYREVIHEDKIKIGKATKAPDYSFRLGGGKRLFFVEAKKPSVFIKDEILPAYQVRRYGWNAKLAVSVITDFEEFAIYDCTKKPLLTDKASVARIKYITFRDYLKEFDFIWNTFSKEHVLKGSFDKFVQSDTYKKGTATVDKAFLQSLDAWRTTLATSIAKNNLNLDEDEINFAVQQTIDRFIFLRMAEDRGVEEYGNLQQAIKEGDYYHNLFGIFLDADKKYNSGLFDFRKDTISKHLTIDNKVIKTIVSELYYPISPYEFSVLAVEILGSAYEQFLGKVIRITAGHHAKIEEKPEVRKAGGVYYTPQYIVDYIVKNTVGKLIEPNADRAEASTPFGGRGSGSRLTPKQIEAIKIVDPACGSGSFLLGAYQYLLDYHRQYYKPTFEKLSAIAADNKRPTKERNDAIKERNKLPVNPTGELSTRLKKQILLNNIYGVDIDVNAVEVTKLSLLLKCMEGETQSSITNEMNFGERVLPTLDNNIKSGNSLIDTDYYGSEFDFGNEKKIKPFSWKKAFPEVFKPLNKTKAQIFKPDLGINDVQVLEEPVVLYKETTAGGFDVVIGNPPYVLLAEDLFPTEVIDYLKKYLVAQYKIDLYHLFIERGSHLLKPNGILGYITPSNWMTQKYTDKLRKFILQKMTIDRVVHFDYKVFDQANVFTQIILLWNKQPDNKHQIRFIRETVADNIIDESECLLEAQKKFLATDDYIIDIRGLTKEGVIANKIASKFPSLEKVARATLGCQAYNSSKHSKEQIENRVFHSDTKKSSDYLPELAGKDVGRYTLDRKRGQWIKYGPWLHDFRTMDWLTGPRILIREITGKAPSKIQTTYVEDTYCNYKTILNVNASTNTNFSMKYLCGVLNSKLVSFVFTHTSNKIEANAFPRLSVGDLKKIPIKPIDSNNSTEKALHDSIVKNVDLLIKLNEELPATKLQTKAEQLKARIDYCEEEINKAVYKLYDLTGEEIKIVEGT